MILCKTKPGKKLTKSLVKNAYRSENDPKSIQVDISLMDESSPEKQRSKLKMHIGVHE